MPENTVSAVNTVAQGLRRVRKLKGRLAELVQRANGSVSYTSDNKPAFDFAETRSEIARQRAELVRIESGIARANASAFIVWEDKRVPLACAIRTLTEIKAEIAEIRGLRLRCDTERHVENEWDEAANRYATRVREVVWVSAMSEPDRVKLLSELADRFERLNDLVETANHQTRLPED